MENGTLEELEDIDGLDDIEEQRGLDDQKTGVYGEYGRNRRLGTKSPYLPLYERGNKEGLKIFEEIEDMEEMEAIEEFSFCGEITSRVSQVCILVMTVKAVTLLRS